MKKINQESSRKGMAKLRERKKEAGLVRRDVWAREEDWPAIRKFEKELQNKLNASKDQMDKIKISDGLTLQHGSDGYWLCCESGSRKGAFSLNNLPAIAGHAFCDWAEK